MAIKMVPDTDMRLQWLDLWHDYIDTVPKMFNHTVKHFGYRPANKYIDNEEWKEIDYDTWAEFSREISEGLLSLGVEIGDNIVIISPTCAEWGWADIGIEMAGGCTTTIFPTLSNDDIKFIINHSAVKYIFTGNNELTNKVKGLEAETPTVKSIICLKNDYDGDDKNIINLSKLREMGIELRKSEPDAFQKRHESIKPSDAATTIYTSGTTGKLKAARYSHGELTGGIWRCLRNQAMGNAEFNATDMAFSVMPLAHVMERTYFFFCMIAVGACLGYGRGPAFLLQDLQALKPTAMVVVPRMLDRVLKGLTQVFTSTPEGAQLWKWALDVGNQMIDARMGEDNTFDASIDPLEELTGELKEEYAKAKAMVFDNVHAALGGRFRCLASGGAALLPELHRPFLGMGFYVPNGYGLTETLCGVGVGRANALKVSWNAPIAPGLEWRQEEDGELLLKGVGIIKEYYNDPEANAESFTADGFFRTGDIVEFDENGIFHIIDRKKAILVMDTGKNVAPAKVEALIMKEIRIDQVLIIGDGKKYLTAFICPNWDEMMAMLDRQGVEYDKSKLRYELVNGLNVCVEVGEDLASNPLVHEIVAKAVETANAELADFERVKKFTILPRKFLQSRDEMTPTSKTKYRVIVKNFADEVEKLYKE